MKWNADDTDCFIHTRITSVFPMMTLNADCFKTWINYFLMNVFRNDYYRGFKTKTTQTVIAKLPEGQMKQSQ